MDNMFTIVTPSLNQAKYLGRAVDSILEQGLSDLDYLVIDGASNDATLSLLHQYKGRVSWISEPDSGPAEAINKGFMRTSGQILAWLNSDDIYYPGAFEKVLSVFAANQDIDVVYGDAAYIDENDTPLAMYQTEPWNWARMRQTCIISQPAAFFRREVFEKYGPLNTNVRVLDYDFWLRLGLHGASFHYLPGVLAGMRRHPKAFSVAQRLELHRQTNDVTRTLLGRTPDTWLTGWACAFIENRGFIPGTLSHAVLGKVLLPLYAAVRWNGTISKSLVCSILRNVFLAFRMKSMTPNIR